MTEQRIAEITLDERSVLRRSPEIEHERATAIADLLHENSFAPASGSAGPFQLHLAVEENRLLIDIARRRRVARDDRSCRSPRSAASSRTISWSARAITMRCAARISARSRRSTWAAAALHNEGSELLIERLAGKVAVDHDTGAAPVHADLRAAFARVSGGT